MSDIAIQNANRHILISEKLHENDENGYAISHLIIGCEELIKALILHLDSVGFRFRQVKGFQSIFENHELRYFLSFILFSMSVFLDDINRVVWDLKEGNQNNRFIDGIINELGENKGALQEKITEILIKKLEFLLSEISWFSEFDLFRQKGFYVDFNNVVVSPLNASADEYNVVKIRVDKIRKTLVEIINGLNQETVKNKVSLDKIFETFKNEKIYTHLENFIARSKKENSGPLNYTANSVSNFLIELKNKHDNNACH